MRHLCWDIDGTLLLTNKAGYHALEQAIKDYLHVDGYKFKYSLAGRTDASIIKDIVTDVRGRCTSGTAAGLMLTYVMNQKKNLKAHEGRLMPNVAETLAYLEENHGDEFRNCLVTGNATEGARDKLIEYGIARYFDFSHSAYGDLAEDRAELARIVFQRLYAAGLAQKPEDLIFIGDTPNDVTCADAIGARCLIILAGSEYGPEDFAENRPWKIIEQLPKNPAEFVAMIQDED